MTSLPTEADRGCVALVVALSCSLAMMLPISTPPNAIAYATGTVQTPQMVVTGLVVGVLGVLLAVLVMPLWWRVLGIG